METSGIMGYIVLENPHTKKEVILFSDIHDGVNYCLDSKSIFIDELFNRVKNDYLILLEEVPRLGVELVELWPGAEHTQRLKNWYMRNSNKIEGIDLRPYLVTFSFQKYFMSKLEDKEKLIKMKDYLEMDILFSPELNMSNISKLEYPQFYEKIFLLLKNLPKHSGVIKYFNELKSRYMIMKSEIKMEASFEDTIKTNPDWFKRLDDLKSDIMDWYTMLLISANNDKRILVHFGLAHFINTVNELKKIGFKEIDNKGVTSYEKISSYTGKDCACIKIE